MFRVERILLGHGVVWTFPLAVFLLVISGCAAIGQPPANHIAKTDEQVQAEAARLKRIMSRRDYRYISGTKALVALPTLEVESARGDWRPLGPLVPAGKAFKIAVSNQSPNIVYVAYGRAGLWVTRDGGVNWISATPRSNDPNIVFTVAVWPKDDRVVAVGIGDAKERGRTAGFNAVKLSLDGGSTWKNISPPDLADFATARVYFDPDDQRRLLVLSSKRLYKTDDAGNTWRSLFEFNYTYADDGWGGLPDMAVHPTNFGTILITHPNHGLQRTVDGGATWQSVGSQITDLGTAVIGWSKSDPRVVYLQTYKFPRSATDQNMRIWRSDDQGTTWVFKKIVPEFNQGRYDMGITVDPVDPNRVLLTNSSYAVTNDAFQTYTSTYGPARVDLLDAQFDPNNPSVVYVATDQGVYKATDRGELINDAVRFDRGVQSLVAFSFDIASTAANPTAVLNAADHGNFLGALYSPLNWQTTFGYEFTAVHTSPHDPNLLFDSGGGQPINRSTDGGATWSSVEFLEGTRDRPYYGPIAFHPTDPNTVFATGRADVYKSTAKGSSGTWTLIGPSASLMPTRILALAVAPGNSNVIYALGSARDLFYTVNGGLAWQQNALSTSGISIDVDPQDASAFLVGGDYELLRCQNFGATCTDIKPTTSSIDTAFRWVRYVSGEPNVYLAGTDLGVLITQDMGLTWKRLGYNFPLHGVTDLKYRFGRWYASSIGGIYELRADQFGQPTTAPSVQVSIFPGQAGTTISWLDVSNTSFYRLFRDDVQIFQSIDGARTLQDTNVSIGRACYSMDAVNAKGYGARSPAQCVNVVTAPQTVTFTPSSPVVLGVSPITLTATASSGLTTFTFATSSAGTICTVSGTQLTIVGVGTCALTTTQAGNASYASASANANIVISPRPLPDLVITAMSADSSAQSGAPVAGSATVKNQGAGSAGASRLQFYASTSNVITTASFNTGFGCDVPVLAPGASYVCVGTISVLGLAPGSYYFGAIADVDSALTESNKSNNTLAANTPTQITGTPPLANGVCGAANGSTTPTIPTNMLCTVGIPTPVSGTGPWNWTCTGSGGGTAASCTAKQGPTSSNSLPLVPLIVLLLGS